MIQPGTWAQLTIDCPTYKGDIAPEGTIVWVDYIMDPGDLLMTDRGKSVGVSAKEITAKVLLSPSDRNSDGTQVPIRHLTEATR